MISFTVGAPGWHLSSGLYLKEDQMKDYLMTISEVLTNLYGIRISNRVTHQLRDGITMGAFVSRGIRYDWCLKGLTLEVTPNES